GLLVNRANRNRGKSENNAENAAGGARGKQIDNSRSRREPFRVARGEHLPPEHASHEQERGCLNDEDGPGGCCRVAKRGSMPEPHRTNAGDPTDERMSKCCEGTRKRKRPRQT